MESPICEIGGRGGGGFYDIFKGGVRYADTPMSFPHRFSTIAKPWWGNCTMGCLFLHTPTHYADAPGLLD